MGCYSYTCSLSGLPITWNDKIVYLAVGPGEQHRGIGPLHAWMPATVPIRGRYNDYGSIEKFERRAMSKVFFDSLARRAIPRPVGENTVHDVAITPDMTPEQWLFALLEERVQYQDPFRGTATLIQAMVREEVWDFLVRFTKKRSKGVGPHDIRHALAVSTWLDRTDLNLPEGEQGRHELYYVSHALAWLGRPWMRGSSSGPQFAAWNLQVEFLELLKGSAQRYLEEHQKEYGEPYVDDP